MYIIELHYEIWKIMHLNVLAIKKDITKECIVVSMDIFYVWIIIELLRLPNINARGETAYFFNLNLKKKIF